MTEPSTAGSARLRPKARASGTLFLIAWLAGCALFPLSEADCKGVNWQSRGYADGFGGHPQQYSRLSSECKERFGVDVPQAEYFAGWRAGYDEWYRLIGSIDMN